MQVVDRRFQIESLLLRCPGHAFEPVSSYPDLLSQDLLIEGHYHDVADVESVAGVRQDAHEIIQVIGLMPIEKVLLEIEGFEDEVCMFVVKTMFAEEWIVANGNVWP